VIGTHIVIAKRPVPGRVKTRLTPPLTPREAAALAAAALTDTIAAVESATATTRMLCFDGDTTDWLPPDWTYRRQRPGGLDARLADALGAAGGPAIVVGMDTPQLDARLLDSFDAERYDACIGPTVDGGYWTIGLRNPAHAPTALLGVPMSTEHTYADQLGRLRSLGLSVQVLDELVDVDTIDDAVTVARKAPQTCFAAAFADVFTEPDAGAA
jgi:rSAM/selenodomain-associated transferase 1